MTLQNHPFLKSGGANEGSSGAALVFVINSPFVPALRVLLKSLAIHGAFTSEPIILITEDEEVREAEGVAEYVDHWYTVGAEDIAQFDNIDNKLVKPRHRLSWIPKYTYMKWNIFRDWGYEKLIFIDADILCLGDISELGRIETDSLAAAAMFLPEMIVKNDQAETDRRVLGHGLGFNPKNKRINSGVMVLGRSVLSDDFRRELIRFTETSRSYGVEQAALRAFLTKESGLGLDTFEPVYNFKSSAVGKLSPHLQLHVLNQVKLLHYAGLAKRPWDLKAPRDLADGLWFTYANWRG